MARVVFLTPDIACEPGPTTLNELLCELDLLASGGTDGPAAARRIRESGELPGEYATLDLREWPGEERIALVRALDHLHNAGRLDEAARLLLDPHTAIFPVRYELRGLAAQIKPSRFVSNSGEYQAGDRIVLGDGSAWTVIDVEAGVTRPRLVLDRP
jgi:hypothetical protein